MYTLNHDNIVKIFNHFEEETHIYLVIEYAEGVNYSFCIIILKI